MSVGATKHGGLEVCCCFILRSSFSAAKQPLSKSFIEVSWIEKEAYSCTVVYVIEGCKMCVHHMPPDVEDLEEFHPELGKRRSIPEYRDKLEQQAQVANKGDCCG